MRGKIREKHVMRVAKNRGILGHKPWKFVKKAKADGGGLKKEGDRNYTKKRGLEMMNEVLKKETNIKTKKEKKD